MENNTLKISTGLKIPLSFFCKGPETEYTVAILLVQGTLKVVTGGKEVFLQERQSIRFGADVPHAYCNGSEEVCTVYNVIFYPDN